MNAVVRVLAIAERPRRDPRDRHVPALVRAGRTARPPAVRECPLRSVEAPSLYVLAALDCPGGTASAWDQTLLAAARELAGVDGAVIAYCAASASLDEIGADRVARAPEAIGYDIELQAACVEAVARQYCARHVLVADHVEGRDLCLRLAAALATEPAVAVYRLTPGSCLRRTPDPASDLEQPLPRVFSVAQEMTGPALRERREAREIPWERPQVSARITDRGVLEPEPDEVALEEAALIVSGGAGVKDWPAFERATRLLGGTRAGTRIACDRGWIPRDRQVGASGHVVQARCYIAAGISGAPQHMEGIERCERVVAINVDPHAPIVQRADLTILCDADAVLRAVAARLEQIP